MNSKSIVQKSLERSKKCFEILSIVNIQKAKKCCNFKNFFKRSIEGT